MNLGLALVIVLAWAYLIGSTAAALRFARRSTPEQAERPPVSLMKPLHGAEPGLYENLRSFVEQDYSDVQVIFGVQHSADGALPIARELVGDYPGRDFAIVVDPHATGSNLKVANLENMLPAAKHDTIVMADSDMRVDRHYLTAVTAPLSEPENGAVTCLYKGMPSGGFWSQLGAMHINFAFLPSALLGEMLRTGGGCFGATIALRRSVLQRIGGFARIRDELADDHRLGDAVRKLGLATVLSLYIVENHVAEPSFASLWRHELRWARTVRAMAPLGFAGSIITHTIVLAVFAAAMAGFSAVGCSLVLVSCILRWISASMIGRCLGLPSRGLWLLPLRDFLSFAVFVGSFCGRSVLWRDQLFRVEPGGRMSVEGDKPV
ncbi:MAG: bacteriohopanetetrol glucosamine biosynthesis glycosyltransferase HpnI [Alphaproteobacteria bacterium]|nr:bacteriohopanetetrol glucosamine biosynthesis glycosyltransferase HpnI [Alphaproteobacteria bacterium]MBV9968134.1 bacteriohopanetetrol glucosamine biosynthesis glycosyltransferase HpnI [Alphaproteobacteria bacterium]